MTKKWLEKYGMPRMHHDKLLKGSTVNTLSGYYKVINGKLHHKFDNKDSFVEVYL